MSALALLYVIGAYAIAFGVITVGAGFWLPLDTGDRILVTLTGFVSIVFGIVMVVKPGDGALVLLALIAAYSLVIGFAELAVAIGGRRVLSALATGYRAPAETQARDENLDRASRRADDRFLTVAIRGAPDRPSLPLILIAPTRSTRLVHAFLERHLLRPLQTRGDDE
jgi:hypothetical protein